MAEGQQKRFGRSIGVSLQNPDFGGLVRAYGLDHVALPGWQGIGEALRKAFIAERMVVVEVQAGLRTPPWSWSE